MERQGQQEGLPESAHPGRRGVHSVSTQEALMAAGPGVAVPWPQHQQGGSHSGRRAGLHPPQGTPASSVATVCDGQDSVDCPITGPGAASRGHSQWASTPPLCQKPEAAVQPPLHPAPRFSPADTRGRLCNPPRTLRKRGSKDALTSPANLPSAAAPTPTRQHHLCPRSPRVYFCRENRSTGSRSATPWTVCTCGRSDQ